MLRKVFQNKGALDPSWEGLFKIVEVLTPEMYKLSYLGGEQVPRSWNVDHLKYIINKVICALINENSAFFLPLEQQKFKVSLPCLLNLGGRDMNEELNSLKILKFFTTSASYADYLGVDQIESVLA